MNPSENDKRQGTAADQNPQRQSLQQWSDANGPERFFAQAGTDQKQGGDKTDPAEMAERIEHSIESRQESIEQRSDAEKQDKPGPLYARLTPGHNCSRHAQRNDPQRSGELDGGTNRERRGTVFGGGADD